MAVVTSHCHAQNVCVMHASAGGVLPHPTAVPNNVCVVAVAWRIDLDTASDLLKLQLARAIGCNIATARNMYPAKEILLKHAMQELHLTKEYVDSSSGNLVRVYDGHTHECIPCIHACRWASIPV